MGEHGIFWFTDDASEKFEGTVFNDQTILLRDKSDHPDLSQKLSSASELIVRGELDSGDTVELELEKFLGIRRNNRSTVVEMTTN